MILTEKVEMSPPASSKHQQGSSIFQSVHLIVILLCVSLQPSRGAESLHLTPVSVRTQWRVGLAGRCQVTSERTISTASRCQSSSPSSSGLSRTPTAATGPRTARHRCRRLRAEAPSWASTASVSWLPGSSSAPSSGPETSHTSQNCLSQSRSAKTYSP